LWISTEIYINAVRWFRQAPTPFARRFFRELFHNFSPVVPVIVIIMGLDWPEAGQPKFLFATLKVKGWRQSDPFSYHGEWLNRIF